MCPGVTTALNLVRQESCARSKRVALVHPRRRPKSPEVWLPAGAGDAASRGLERGQETRLSALQPGRSATADESQAPQAHRAVTRQTASTYRSEPRSMDFVHDQMLDGRRFRILAVIDQWSRESVCLEANFRQTGREVGQALDRAAMLRG